MIHKNLNSIPKNINFINTKSFKFEDEFHILKKIFNVNIYNVDDIDLEENKKYLTINLDYYLKNKDKINLDLLIISVDHDNSHFLNLIKYIKTNNLKKFKYSKNNFKKFLFNNFPLKEINSRINKFLSHLNIKISRYKINKYINIPKINIIDDTYKGYRIGKSSYNFYVPTDKKFDFLFNTVSFDPPILLAIIGFPIDCASTATRPKASGSIEAETTTSAKEYAKGISLQWLINLTFLFRLYLSTRFINFLL